MLAAGRAGHMSHASSYRNAPTMQARSELPGGGQRNGPDVLVQRCSKHRTGWSGWSPNSIALPGTLFPVLNSFQKVTQTLEKDCKLRRLTIFHEYFPKRSADLPH